MPSNRKVVYTSGVPVVADFNATDGAPLCVNQLTGTVYYLSTANAVIAIAAGISSIGLDLPTTLFTVSGSPLIANGTINAAFVSGAANLVLATPAAAVDRPSLRALVDSDIPNALTINGGTINNTTIGGSTASTAVFTSVSASSASSLSVTASSARFTTITATGTGNFLALLNLSATSAGQIAFPSAQNPSTDANTFDDCEEGTCTLTFAGRTTAGAQTYVVQVSLYEKLAQLVHVQSNLGLSAKDGGSAGNLEIRGLPFPANSTTNCIAGMSPGYHNAFDLNLIGLYYSMGGVVAASESTIQLFESGDNVATAALTVADFGNTTAIAFSMTYRANA